MCDGETEDPGGPGPHCGVAPNVDTTDRFFSGSDLDGLYSMNVSMNGVTEVAANAVAVSNDASDATEGRGGSTSGPLKGEER